MSDLSEEEIKVFVEAIDNYFLQVSRDRATIERAFLVQDVANLPTFELTGIIRLSKDYRGSIYFSAPKAMLRQLLTMMREPNQSDEQLADAVGEVTNTLAGNARKHFGDAMEISVPSVLSGSLASAQHMRPRPYVIMIHWRGLEAALIIDIERLR